MKNKLLLILFLLANYNTFAQKESWNWYFGNYAAVDFSNGNPVAMTNSAMTNSEGVASISDTSGNLLFYTNGLSVYDSTHTQMSNGFGLFGDPSATQSGIIVKKPASDSLYYIFTVDYGVSNNGLNYSIVDMSLNSGKGDVTTKNIYMNVDAREKVTAIQHFNKKDFWIMVINWANDDLYTYLVDSSGVNLIPVISPADSLQMQLGVGGTNRANGYLKSNRQGNRIAMGLWAANSFDLFDFDNTTGIASNHIKIQGTQTTMYKTYGVEFSPDGTKLYGTTCENNPVFKLFQFDLTAGTPIDVYNSRTTIASTSSGSYYYTALQIAPDGKIYCSLYNQTFLGAINNPDSLGAACNYVNNSVSLNGRTCGLGLPNIISDYILPIQLPSANLSSTDTSFCEKHCLDFTDLSTNNPTSWQWFFPGADSTSSTLQNPANICYNNYGSFDVTLIACNGNGCDTLFLPNFITEYQSPSAMVSQSNDTLYSSAALTYQWVEISSGPISGATYQYFVPTQPGSYFCLITDSIGCNASSNTIAITSIFNLPISDFQFQIQPNPNDGNFEVVFNKHLQNKKYVLRINDSYGRVVFTTNTQTSKLKLNLADGVYFVEFITGEKTYEQKFIVKSK